MRKTFRTLGAAGVLMCLVSATAAAQGNNSDHLGTGVSTSSVTGIYSPGPAGGGSPVTPSSVSSETRSLSGGSTSQRAVGAVLGGGSTAALGNSLSGAGTPAAQVAALMSALTELGTNPSPAALKAAILAYNDAINKSPASFWNNPPASIGAIRGALLAIRDGQ